MKRINKLTQKLGRWFTKDSDSGESESPLLLQSLEDRVLYSAVPLPVDNVDAPVENTDLDEVQFSEIESNTTPPIGEAIAEDTTAQFLAEDIQNADFVAASADATLEDLEQMINAIELSDSVSTENDEPETAMTLAEATLDPAGFHILQEGQSFTIDFNFLGNPTGNQFAPFGQGFTLVQEPSSGQILVNGEPLQANGTEVSEEQIAAGEVIFVPDTNFVGNDNFTLLGNLGFVGRDFQFLYVGVADDGLGVFGDTFAPVDGSAPAFEATAIDSETHVEPLSNGGYVVVSSLGASDGEVRFQIFGNDGVAIGNEVVAASDFHVENVDTVAIDDGGFLIAYASSGLNGDEQLNIRRFNANGVEQSFTGSALTVTPITFSDFNDISLEYLGGERYVVSYIPSNTLEVQSILLNLDGTPERTFDNSVIPNGNNISIETEVLADGGFVVARVEDSISSNSIFAFIFDPGGHPQEHVEIALGVTGSEVAIAGTPDNGFVVVWQGTSTDSTGIYAATFDRLGNQVLPPAFIAEGTTATSASPDVIALGDGSFVVSHTAVDSNRTQEVLGHRLNADLSRLGESFTINSFNTGDQTDGEIAQLADGTLVATFNSGDLGDPQTIFHQRLQMSIEGDEDTWIPLNSVIGPAIGASTEMVQNVVFTGFEDGVSIRAVDPNTPGNSFTQTFSSTNSVLTFNNVQQFEFQGPSNGSGIFEGTATVVTNDGQSAEDFITDFQVVVNPVVDSPASIITSPITTDEDTAIPFSQEDLIGNFIDVDGAPADPTDPNSLPVAVLPNDLVNPISNVSFEESDFEDRIRVLPSPTSGITSSFIFNGVEPLTAELPALSQAATFEFWIRSEDFPAANV